MLYHDEILFDLLRGEEPTAIYGDILLDDDTLCVKIDVATIDSFITKDMMSWT